MVTDAVHWRWTQLQFPRMFNASVDTRPQARRPLHPPTSPHNDPIDIGPDCIRLEAANKSTSGPTTKLINRLRPTYRIQPQQRAGPPRTDVFKDLSLTYRLDLKAAEAQATRVSEFLAQICVISFSGVYVYNTSVDQIKVH